MLKAAIMDDYQNMALALAPWNTLDPPVKIDVFTDHLADETAVARRLHPYDIVVLMRERTPFPSSLIEKLPNLKLLVTSGNRNRAIDMKACAAKNIVVCGTGSARSRSHPTAELTWGLILALTKHIPSENLAIRKGKWGVGMSVGLGGKVLGVIGLGNVGSVVARTGLCFGMEVIAWSQNLTQEHARALGATKVEKNELFARSDIITIHVILSQRTRGMIGEKELELMKPSAYLVNTSRGPIVDEKALLDALVKQKIAGAGLDVFDMEPLPSDHPLLGLENTVLTPHIGYVTRENFEVYYRESLEDIQAGLDGKPIRKIEA